MEQMNNNSDSNPVYVDSSIKFNDKQGRSKFLRRTLAIGVGSLAVFAGVVKASTESQADTDYRLAPMEATVDGTIPTDTTDPGIDTTTTTIPTDTTDPGIDNTTTIPTDTTDPGIDNTTTIPTDTTDPGIDTTTTTSTTTTTTTTIPDLGEVLRTYENDSDNQIQIGQIIKYVVTVENLDPKIKNVDIASAFISSDALAYINNVNYLNCGSPVNESSDFGVRLFGAQISPNSTCTVTFDALAGKENGRIQQYARVDNRTAGRTYTDYSDILYS